MIIKLKLDSMSPQLKRASAWVECENVTNNRLNLTGWKWLRLVIITINSTLRGTRDSADTLMASNSFLNYSIISASFLDWISDIFSHFYQRVQRFEHWTMSMLLRNEPKFNSIANDDEEWKWWRRWSCESRTKMCQKLCQAIGTLADFSVQFSSCHLS